MQPPPRVVEQAQRHVFLRFDVVGPALMTRLERPKETPSDAHASFRNAAVPHFVLQPLVENALRHAIAKRVEAGLVQIAARREGDDLVLSVRDDGPGLDVDTVRKGAGVGLANTRERLTTLYGSRGRLELMEMREGGALATIRLPFHPVTTPGEVTGGG